MFAIVQVPVMREKLEVQNLFFSLVPFFYCHHRFLRLYYIHTWIHVFYFVESHFTNQYIFYLLFIHIWTLWNGLLYSCSNRHELLFSSLNASDIPHIVKVYPLIFLTKPKPAYLGNTHTQTTPSLQKDIIFLGKKYVPQERLVDWCGVPVG